MPRNCHSTVAVLPRRFWTIGASTGARLGQLHARSTIRTLIFDETGTRLLTHEEGEVARVWALDLDELIEIARQSLTRPLTPAECERYLQTEC